jgi:hypothetical protein
MIFDFQQVKKLRNDCAAIALPVGFLCQGLNTLGVKNLGVGGYNGFLDKSNNIIQNKFLEVNTFDGHSVALNDANFEAIREFMLGNDSMNAKSFSEQIIVDSPPFFMQHRHRFAAPYIIVIVLLLVGGAFWSFSFSGIIFILYIAVLFYLLWLF